MMLHRSMPMTHASCRSDSEDVVLSRKCRRASNYEFTEMGASMLPALQGFTSCIRDNWPRIEDCRRGYDARGDA